MKLFALAVIAVLTLQIVRATDEPTIPLQPAPRSGDIPVLNTPGCWTGHEKRDHGKRIAEIVFENGTRLWVEVTTEDPLCPICGN